MWNLDDNYQLINQIRIELNDKCVTAGDANDTLMQKASDQGRVTMTMRALRPVNTRVQGPGPVGSAEMEEMVVIIISIALLYYFFY